MRGTAGGWTSDMAGGRKLAREKFARVDVVKVLVRSIRGEGSHLRDSRHGGRCGSSTSWKTKLRAECANLLCKLLKFVGGDTRQYLGMRLKALCSRKKSYRGRFGCLMIHVG